MRSLATIAVTVSLLMLTGCVSLRLATNANPALQTQTPRQRIQALKTIKKWSIQGALSLQAKGKTSLANYTWTQHNRSQYDIFLRSNLNLYVLHIQGRPGQVIIDDQKNPPQSAPTPSRLIKKLIGYPLPINNLYYWVRGLSAPGAKQTHYDRYGHLIGLRQQNWRLQFSHFLHVKQVDLPQMIDITSPELTMRIVIKQWNI